MKSHFSQSLFYTLILLVISTSAFSNTLPLYLDQSWTKQQRQTFYSTAQGSYLIPLNWFKALEQADNVELFSADKNIKRYNYLTSKNQPANLPIGFAIEVRPDNEKWVGYTCAACHTNEIHFNNVHIRIDGAPSLADFNGFINQLYLAVNSTVNNKPKFLRFAARVLNNNKKNQLDSLLNKLQAFETSFSQYIKRNKVTVDYGYARLDAFGITANELLVDQLQILKNQAEPNAPVSIPFLWGSANQDWVQWNGSLNNPIARNVGGVLGTFGHVNLINKTNFGSSTARARNVLELERLITSVTAPKWPEQVLGKIDSVKAARGKAVYLQKRSNEASCVSCHALKDNTGQYPLTPADENLFGKQFVKTTMIPLADIGTDPLMALNFVTRKVYSGSLAAILPAPFTGKALVPMPVLIATIVEIATQKAIATTQPAFTKPELAELIGYRKKSRGLPDYRPPNLLAYIGRSLEGIWATAPYLHNGSVPNLKELLKPQAKRIKKFYVGSQQFDVGSVGFLIEKKTASSLFDVTQPGNSNAGHLYGTTLSSDDKSDLLEYLKTL